MGVEFIAGGAYRGEGGGQASAASPGCSGRPGPSRSRGCRRPSLPSSTPTAKCTSSYLRPPKASRSQRSLLSPLPLHRSDSLWRRCLCDGWPLKDGEGGMTGPFPMAGGGRPSHPSIVQLFVSSCPPFRCSVAWRLALACLRWELQEPEKCMRLQGEGAGREVTSRKCSPCETHAPCDVRALVMGAGRDVDREAQEEGRRGRGRNEGRRKERKGEGQGGRGSIASRRQLV